MNDSSSDFTHEIELKFHVPKASQLSIEKTLKQGTCTAVNLIALYFDTPDRQLAHKNVALRLRLENQQWIQTLKMPGANTLTRLELNHLRPGPELDLSVYNGTPAQPLFKKLSMPLNICYETHITRTVRMMRTQAAAIEVAYDLGCILAADLMLPVSEIEFELKKGNIDALFAIGKKWQQAHGLILDARSKAERGDELAQLYLKLQQIDTNQTPAQETERALAIAYFWRPRTAKSSDVGEQQNAPRSLQAIMKECLDQIIRNTAVLAEVDTLEIRKVATAEHAHQLRVGIRRLRAAWSLFKGIDTLPSPYLKEAIRNQFALLGVSRDSTVLWSDLWPTLLAAGQPPLQLESNTQTDHAHQVAKDNHFQTWLLQMLEFVITPSNHAFDASDSQLLKHLLSRKLNKWHQQISRDGLKFGELDTEKRHRLRKSVKKLRYALQFCESFLPSQRFKKYQKQLARTQEILGEMNDLSVALDKFKVLSTDQPQALFACGWIHARLDALKNDAVVEFKHLNATTTAWK